MTGETILSELEDIFTLAGIVDAETNKGVRLWFVEKQENLVPTINDISAMANALKIQFEKTRLFSQ